MVETGALAMSGATATAAVAGSSAAGAARRRRRGRAAAARHGRVGLSQARAAAGAVGGARGRFPHTLDSFPLDDPAYTLRDPEEVVRLASQVLSAERLERFERAAAGRTNAVTCVLEGLYDTGNVAAVCRSAEALGVHTIHTIDSCEKSKVSARAASGAEKWLHRQRWQSTAPCIERLKADGYRVVCTHLSRETVPIGELDWTQPTAVLFGNEHAGASDEAVELADACVSVPMDGLVESFNVSVAAALVFYHARQDRLARQGFHGDLSEDERRALVAHFCLRHDASFPAVLRNLLLREQRRDP